MLGMKFRREILPALSGKTDVKNTVDGE